MQLEHIDFRPVKIEVEGETLEVLAITLPPSVTKGGKTTGQAEHVYAGTERLKQELVKRRFTLQRKPDAYVFGSEDGRRIKSFKKMWRELFKLAGLDYGRSKGLTWHTIRHEFVSRTLENTGDPVVAQELARHKDLRTTQGYLHARRARIWSLGLPYTLTRLPLRRSRRSRDLARSVDTCLPRRSGAGARWTGGV